MIRKLLVANRGEIARRIFRTCRTMGIGTVAVFSDVDARSTFVDEADEAFALGGNAPSESYLRIERIVEAAKATGADAIHPGYGFLAENASFAQAVLDAGLTWIGPSVKAIGAMGSKLESKRLVVAASVPTLPSIDLTGLDTKAAMKAAADIGYPVLVKASAGGGGKGMRIVPGPAALEEAVAAAGREAASAFGDDTVFLERYLDSPRHIEIQVFADGHGHLVSLFERECSIQRRHQKIVEEAPSPAIDEDTRTRMGDAAIAVASAVAYEGAGTVEFLVQGEEFFFLEMNTRLQVEHAVTEEITGLDLVRLQILVAQGESLPEEALQPAMLGHAIEVRLYAEDPTNDFLPISGRLDRFELFEAPGLRVDAGVESGAEISIYYDPMIAKVIAWGDTREEAASLLAGALQRARLHGLITNRDLLVRILRHRDFLSGDTDTHFLERHPPAELGASLVEPNEVRVAAVAASLAAQAERRQAAQVHPTIPSGWRNSPSQCERAAFNIGETEIIVGYRFEPRGGTTIEVDGRPLPDLVVSQIDPRSVVVESDGDQRLFEINRVGSVHHVDGPSGYVRLVEIDRFPIGVVAEEPGSLHAPMPGKVVRVSVTEGDAVREGQVLVVMEAMKMEHTLRAPHAGTVASIRAAPGEQVAADQILVVIDSGAS